MWWIVECRVMARGRRCFDYNIDENLGFVMLSHATCYKFG
jgi:hypothetical protein